MQPRPRKVHIFHRQLGKVDKQPSGTSMSVEKLNPGPLNLPIYTDEAERALLQWLDESIAADEEVEHEFELLLERIGAVGNF